MDAEAGARERDALHLQLGVEVGVATVVVQRDERVEQIHAAGEEDRHQDGSVGRRRGVGGRRLEHARERHRLGSVERQASAETGPEHLPAREARSAEEVAAHGLRAAVEVVAGAMANHQ